MSHAAPDPSARVLLLTKYGRRAASTRFRALQYIPFFEAAGLQVDISPLFGDRYLASLLDDGRMDVFEAIKGMIGRVLALKDVRQYSLVVIHMEALPYLPPLFEQLLNRLGVPYIYDFDDASFHQYDRHASRLVRALLSDKIRHVIEGAALVVAGNEYLAEYARRFNRHVEIVPTVVDIERFTPASADRPPGTVVIGWIGSPSTAAHVIEHQALWRRVAEQAPCVFRLIGAGQTAKQSPWFDARPWREDSEMAEIRDFDIGIMPLPDDHWSKGKCGFKLIEYLACGVPSVASPTGVNARIVVDGENGFLCRTDDEWVSRLVQLIREPRLRLAMGARGRELACEHWSLQKWGPVLAGLLAREARADRTAA